MSLMLMRHQKPDIAPGICYGRLDVQLAAGWQLEAEQLAAKLPPLQRLISSPLQRARKLAEYVAERRDLKLQVDAAFSEYNFGDWEGRSWDDIGKPAIDRWLAGIETYQGHGGESAAQFRHRVQTGLAGLRNQPQVLVICHAGVIRAALNRPGPDSWGWQMDYASLHRLEAG